MNLRYSSRIILLICAIATVANAQIQVHFGVEAGIPLTDTLSSTSTSSAIPGSFSFDRYNSETKRLLIGPAFRVDLQRGLGIEFDALYQRVNYDHSIVNSVFSGASFSFEQTTGNRWQFPVADPIQRDTIKNEVFCRGRTIHFTDSEQPDQHKFDVDEFLPLVEYF